MIGVVKKQDNAAESKTICIVILYQLCMYVVMAIKFNGP